jgi:ABC-2 type transport system ATP-binding protein
MLQRVGIAQALINDPEVIFLDEPMSGLDPLGRREIRELILRLRDRGCTVFFSSHVLADAEALCNRVAVVANGRLVTSGSISDIVAFQIRGWELVVRDISGAALERATTQCGITRVTQIDGGRYALELPPEATPDRILATLISDGAHLVSLNPVRETLEDFFVRQVSGVYANRGLDG